MKAKIMVAVFTAAALNAMAQGTMQFQNGATSPVRIYTFSGTRNAVASDNLVVAMFWGTTASNVVNVGGTAVITTSTLGVFAGSTVWPVAGTNPGDTLFFQVAAWDMSYGTTFAGMQACLAAGGLFGTSSSGPFPGGFPDTLQFSLGATAGPGTVMFGSTATTGVFHLFVVGSVPEPSTTALGALGVAAWLALNRRHRSPTPK